MTTVERERTGSNGTEHQELTAAELRRELEERTMEEFGLPVDEFMARLRAGELDSDSVVVADIAAMARLLQHAEMGNRNAAHRERARRHGFFRRLFG